MQIKFKEMNEQELINFKGGEKSVMAKMFTDDDNRIVMMRLVPGASVGLHRHEGSSETVYFLQGKGEVLEDGVWTSIQAGDCHYCPEGCEHSIKNNSEEELVFFAVVPQHA